MTTIRLGFKAFDPHELLCHFMASSAGLYAREGLSVELTDITFTPDADLATCQVSCGAALMGALQGNPQHVVFVATDQPMFWLYGAADVPGIAALRGRTIATYPASAPPAQFMRIILQRAGLDPDVDVRLTPARDDVARAGLLRSGNVAGAVLGSGMPPPVAERLGFRTLNFFGDTIRMPTTGLAVPAQMLAEHRDLVAALVRVLKGGLDRLHGEPDRTARVLHEIFNIDAMLAPATAALLARHFTRNGRTDPAIARLAIETMRSALGTERSLEWDQFYDFALLAAA